MAKRRKKTRYCKIPFRISEAGHLLKTTGSSQAGSYLASEAKKQKTKRKSKGCLNGTGGVFKLTESQKRKLPARLQKAILAYHRKKGKKIID